MKNKKGFLLAEETLKIVITIICLVFLVGFLGKLYYNHKEDKDLELAKASLEHLIEEMDAKSRKVMIYNPGNPWMIVGWPVEEEIPSKCSDSKWENCLCICKMPLIPTSISPENIRNVCEKKGICEELSQKIVTKEENYFYIQISKPPLTLNIDYEDKKITKDES